jgi:prophage DNA circulation protein
MATILDIPNTRWRDELLPATFAGQQFHVDSSSRENGQRVVVHEFPKKDLPYAELMGRRAIEFTVRGYCIAYPFDSGLPLYMRDYRIARDNLMNALETGQAATLQLPTLAPMVVVCPRYRLSEEARFGGFCTFDMTFVELGVQSMKNTPDTQSALVAQSQSMRQRILQVIGQGTNTTPGGVPLNQ